MHLKTKLYLAYGSNLNLEQMAAAALSNALHQDALTQYSNDQHPLKDILERSIL